MTFTWELCCTIVIRPLSLPGELPSCCVRPLRSRSRLFLLSPTLSVDALFVYSRCIAVVFFDDCPLVAVAATLPITRWPAEFLATRLSLGDSLGFQRSTRRLRLLHLCLSHSCSGTLSTSVSCRTAPLPSAWSVRTASTSFAFILPFFL